MCLLCHIYYNINTVKTHPFKTKTLIMHATKKGIGCYTNVFIHR